jgi:hypothetical protein
MLIGNCKEASCVTEAEAPGRAFVRAAGGYRHEVSSERSLSHRLVLISDIRLVISGFW